jgi:leader peptidase (prepilin peptidase)/N-methyltransferase
MSPIAWPLLAVIVATLLVITVYDLRHLIIPDSLVLVLVVAAIGLLGHEVYLSGAIMLLPQALLAGGLASLVYWSLWRVSAGRWIGFGDVKLAFPLGMLVGLSGVLSLVVWSFWLGAIISVALLTGQYLMRRGKRPLRILAEPLTMKSEVPFAPFLVLAFLLVYFGQADVVALTGYALNLLLT